jgi:hypothetical protein
MFGAILYALNMPKDAKFHRPITACFKHRFVHFGVSRAKLFAFSVFFWRSKEIVVT